MINRDGQGSCWTVGVTFEIFMVGGPFPFYKILADSSAIFIILILSPQFEIFMGVPPTENHLNFL